MSSLPDWMKDAVSPTADEIDRLSEPLDPSVIEGCAELTRPTPAEVQGLVRRMRAGSVPTRPVSTVRLRPALRYALVAAVLLPASLVLAAGVRQVLERRAATSIESAPPTPMERTVPVEVEAPAPAPASVEAAVLPTSEPSAPAPVLPVEAVPVAARPEPPPLAEPTSLPESLSPIQDDSAVAVLDPATHPPEDVRHFTRIQESIDMHHAPTATLRLVELFLQRHPASDLADEARVLQLELLAQTAPPRQAMSALDGWLASNPDHPQFLTMLESRANVARNGLRNCRMALPSYRVLATRASGERKARGKAWRGLCAWSEGLNDEASEALLEAIDDPFLPENLRFEVTEALAAVESSGRVMPMPMRRAQ